MKKTSLIALLTLIIVTSARAQEENDYPRHTVRVGVSAFPLLSLILVDNWEFNIPSPGNAYDQGQQYSIYSGCKYALYSASYTYAVTKKLEVGANVSYGGNYRRENNFIDNSTVERYGSHMLYISPVARLNYFQSNGWRLYFGLSLGLLMDFSTYYDAQTKARASASMILPTLNVTYFGVSYGKKVFGFFELNGPMEGFATAGIGYRFN